MTDTQDRHLLAAIKRAMGRYYDNTKTCVYNVEALVKKCDDLIEPEFKTPKKYYKDRDNAKSDK